MLDQTKDLLNQLIATNHRLLHEGNDHSLLRIKLMIIETLLTSMTFDINNQSINHLRGLEKTLVIKLLHHTYLSLTDKNDFNFSQSSLNTSFKYLLATLTEHHYSLDQILTSKSPLPEPKIA